jgi:DNA-binding NarL/FixJ family response regulator
VTRRSAPSAASIAMPRGLRAAHFKLGAEEFAVLSFELPVVVLPAQLTKAECAVTTALLNGKRNAEIAQARRTAVRTVATQVAAIFRKLGVTSRAELVALLSSTAADS